MKTFSTSGTGIAQTLSEIESEKIPVYDDLDAVIADLANLSVGQIGTTKDTGTELSQPVDVVEEGNLHAVTSNAVAECLSYSTTEHKTGKKWIDGKDIYSIVLVQSGQITTNTAYFATEMANLNIDTITLKFAKAKVLSGGTVIRNNMIEYYANASDYLSVSVSEISAIPLFNGNVLSDLEVTLEYTKTTD